MRVDVALKKLVPIRLFCRHWIYLLDRRPRLLGDRRDVRGRCRRLKWRRSDVLGMSSEATKHARRRVREGGHASCRLPTSHNLRPNSKAEAPPRLRQARAIPSCRKGEPLASVPRVLFERCICRGSPRMEIQRCTSEFCGHVPWYSTTQSQDADWDLTRLASGGANARWRAEEFAANMRIYGDLAQNRVKM